MFPSLEPFILFAQMLFYFFFISIMMVFVGWVPTHAAMQTTWTRDDALHLARKVLFHPTLAIVDQLTTAGSASGAVAILFPNQDGPSKSHMDEMINKLMSMPGFVLEGWADHPRANRLYHTIIAHDPYEAKAKLSLLWYDMFAVNKEGDIRHADIVDQQRLLYNHTLGNFKTMVQRHMFNNNTPLGTGQGGRGDYAVGRFIDLLHQNVNFPNENYARELLQLFLMGEYDILDTPGQAKPNYTDEDVIALAKKLTGLEADPVSHQVRFNPNQRNQSSGISLLSGPLAPGYNPAMFPYRDPTTDTINLSQAHVSINENNGLFDNTINYIFAKRESTIARFVAYQLYKYYVDDRIKLNNVTGDARTHIQELANEFIANGYEILPTVRRLLTRNRMYNEEVRSVPQKKTPIELVIGTIKAFEHRNPNHNNIHVLDGFLLSRFGWIPYYPGSIFGRDGFDDADIWINDYIVNLRMTHVTTMTFAERVRHWDDIIQTGRFEILSSTGLVTSTSLLSTVPTSPEDYIHQLETIFFGSTGVLPSSVVNHIISYMIGDGNAFDPTNSGFVDTRMRGAIALILSQPEYLLKQGQTSYREPPVAPPSLIAGPNKIIFLELFGGYDWIYGIIPQDQYMRYVADRTILAVPFSNLHAKGVHLFNNKLKPLSDLQDTNNLITIHGVGNPGHSRGHDTAQRQSTSAFNQQFFGAAGLFGELIKNDNPSNTYVLGLNKPNIFSRGQFTNIGPSSSRIIFSADMSSPLASIERERLVSFITGSLIPAIRPSDQYPGPMYSHYQGAIKLDDVANKPGVSSPGWTLSGQLAYIHKLLTYNMGSAFYTVGGHGFDTHAGQQVGDLMNNKIDSFARDVRHFFDTVKNNYNITIVIHTEFGRTIKRNGSDGTDHGEGGGYFIITNNVNVQNAFPKKSYGRIDLINTKRDWLGVGIDYRAVYRRLFEALYNVTPSFVAGFDLDKEIDTTPPRFIYTHQTFGAQSDRSPRATIHADIEDVNFRPKDMASHVWVAWGTRMDRLQQENFWITSKDVIRPNGSVAFTKLRQKGGEMRFFAFTGMDNQHITTFITGAVKIPNIRSASQFTYNDTGNHLIFRAYEETVLNGGLLSLPTPILIPADTYRLTPDSPILYVPSNTQVTTLEGSGARSGTLLLPHTIDPNHFVSASSMLRGTRMRDTVIHSLVKAGPDTRGLGANLTSPVIIMIPTTTSATYDIYYSRDGEVWVLHGTTGVLNNTINIQTDKLGYFAVVDSQAVACNIVVRQIPGFTGNQYHYAIDILGKNATSWILAENGVGVGAGSGISGSVQRTIVPNITYVYQATVTNGSVSNTCSRSINHVVSLSAPAPSCTLTHSQNADGSFTLTRIFIGGTPLAATLAGNQDVGDITNLSVRTQRTIPPVNSLTTYTLTTRGIGDEKTCTTVIDTRKLAGQTTPPSGGGGGGGGGGLRMDICPNRDNSPSYYDGLCDPISQITSLFEERDPESPQSSGGTNELSTWMTPDQKHKMDRLMKKIDRKFQKNSKKYGMLLNRIIAIAARRYKQSLGVEQWNYLKTLAESRLEAPKPALARPTQSQLVTWMYKNGFTRYDTVSNFRPHAAITREQLARMVVMADMMHNPTKTISNTRNCTFVDTSQIDPTLVNFVLDACQRGLMQGSAGKFMPKQRVTYAQATAVIDRILNGERKELSPRWAVYMNAARLEGYLPRDWQVSSPGVNEALNRGNFAELLYNVAVVRNKE